MEKIVKRKNVAIAHRTEPKGDETTEDQADISERN